MASIEIPICFKSIAALPPLAQPLFERLPAPPATQHFSYRRDGGDNDTVSASTLTEDELLLVWIQSEPPGNIVDAEFGSVLSWHLVSAKGKFVPTRIECLRVHLQLLCFRRVLGVLNEVYCKLRSESLAAVSDPVVPSVIGQFIGARLQWACLLYTSDAADE